MTLPFIDAIGTGPIPCPCCGICDRLTSGWSSEFGTPQVLFCEGCGTPMVRTR